VGNIFVLCEGAGSKRKDIVFLVRKVTFWIGRHHYPAQNMLAAFAPIHRYLLLVNVAVFIAK
jgi:hypothetical protein